MQKKSISLFKLAEDGSFSEDELEKMKALLEAGADPNYKQNTYPFETVLYRVLSGWDEEEVFEAVKVLHQYGVDFNLMSDIFYPIDLAVRNKDKELVRFMLENGASLGLDQALKSAIECNDIEMTRLLLSYPIDLTVFEAQGASYLSFCCETYRLRDRHKHYEVQPGIELAKTLILQGASPNGVNNDASPLLEAIRHDFCELVDLLLENGAETPPSHDLVRYTFTEDMLEYLITKGLLKSLNDVEPIKNQTPLVFYSSLGNRDLVKHMLKNHEVDIYHTDASGLTAFHYALFSENAKYIEELLKFYDIKKCHKISSVFEGIDNKNLITKLKELIGEHMEEPSKPAILANHRPDDVYKELEQRAQKLEEQLRFKCFFFDGYFPEFINFYNEDIVNLIYDQLLKNLSIWAKNVKGPLQALYFEYGGRTIDPYESGGLFWGYSNCNENLKLSTPVLQESGALDLSVFFDNIDELLKTYPNQYQEICEYFELLAFMIVHIAFQHLASTSEFKTLEIQYPFYLIGSEHEEDPILIFKI